MLKFQVDCKAGSPACHAKDVYEKAGQIISDNLDLNREIIVKVVVDALEQNTLASTLASETIVEIDGIDMNYPTALSKQKSRYFNHEGHDIYLGFNSNYDHKLFYPGTGEITPDQCDFLSIVLHELQHGLGIGTSWTKLLDDDHRQLFPEGFSYTKVEHGIEFDSFVINYFDNFLYTQSVSGGNDHVTSYMKALNTIAGPGTIYESIDDFYQQIINKQREAGKSYSGLMLTMAVNKHKIRFVPTNNYNDAIMLETSYYPFRAGSSISHFAADIFQDSPDFLMKAECTKGKTLDEQVEATGSNLGGGMGPKLRLMLGAMGYKLRINPESANAPANSTSTNIPTIATNSKPKKNKEKRTIAL